MARGRGIVLSGSTIVSLKGEEVTTFHGCDEEYLALDDIEPGDFVTFGTVSGTSHADRIRKATPTPKELTTHAALFADVAQQVADQAARSPAAKTGQPPARALALVAPMVAKLVELGLIPPTVNVAALTKELAPTSPVLAGTILAHARCRRFVRCDDRHDDSEFVDAFHRALTGLPVRIALLAASLRTGFQIEFRADTQIIDTDWFPGPSAVAERLDKHLATHHSPRRVLRLPCAPKELALLLATPDEIAALRT